MEKNEVKTLSFFVLRSSYRKEVFFQILKKPYLTQSELLKLCNIPYRSHISRTIRELEEKKLIKCENPDEKRYKLYNITKNGLLVKEEIKKYNKLKY